MNSWNNLGRTGDVIAPVGHGGLLYGIMRGFEAMKMAGVKNLIKNLSTSGSSLKIVKTRAGRNDPHYRAGGGGSLHAAAGALRCAEKARPDDPQSLLLYLGHELHAGPVLEFCHSTRASARQHHGDARCLRRAVPVREYRYQVQLRGTRKDGKTQNHTGYRSGHGCCEYPRSAATSRKGST